MKKAFILLSIFFLNLIYVNATFVKETVVKVELDKCIDGDTARFIYDNKSYSTRFLAINAPEYTNKKEEFGFESSMFVCEALKNSKNIYLEFDKNSDIYDKYNRLLAWVFVDDILLQDEIIKNGFAEVDYLYGDYKYTDILKKSQSHAMNKKINIWTEKNFKYLYFFILIIAIIVNYLIFKDKKILKKNLKKIFK